jgi:hypothetical protein
MPRDAVAGAIGLCVAGALAIVIKLADLWRWHVDRKPLSNLSAGMVKAVR